MVFATAAKGFHNAPTHAEDSKMLSRVKESQDDDINDNSVMHALLGAMGMDKNLIPPYPPSTGTVNELLVAPHKTPVSLEPTLISGHQDRF
ncbi:hypothetical protein DACRYDRAFT_110145 [Dacryopinax primogenitus]|uniref:Uncharacterized protein n=1 Tax=Dacryopinax primogenitus (strain DJM 731) TaxID=1858805 RepID=M5FTK4_DACPD|nr:uncharacterized protein DACRYDRAFT_110145 [Dacryopinax primogenitus]EJT99423.1 hypothetical protein DACRYDRAFT_110145 [Dacryopinax primogenitus]